MDVARWSMCLHKKGALRLQLCSRLAAAPVIHREQTAQRHASAPAASSRSPLGSACVGCRKEADRSTRGRATFAVLCGIDGAALHRDAALADAAWSTSGGAVQHDVLFASRDGFAAGRMPYGNASKIRAQKLTTGL